MEPEILLHIGGIADGERRKVTHHRMRVHAQMGELRLNQAKTQIVSDMWIDDCLYLKTEIAGSLIMIEENMTAEQAVALLISKYPAPKDDD